MLIHAHLPKTAGTTFNFGIIPQIISPHRSRVLGSEMPIKTVGHLHYHNLFNTSFLSGHKIYKLVEDKKIRKFIFKNSFIFGFARSGYKFIPSVINQLLKKEDFNINYERINERLIQSFNDYVNNAEFIAKSNNSALLSSNSEKEFLGSLKILYDKINLPIILTKKRNTSVKKDLNLDDKKIINLDLDIIEEIYQYSKKSSEYIDFSCQNYDYIALMPRRNSKIRPIFGKDIINLSFKTKYILWITNHSIKNILVSPINRVDNISRFFFKKIGARVDMMMHEPSFYSENFKLPKNGLGIPLRYPFNEWEVKTNLESELIGYLYSYEIDFL